MLVVAFSVGSDREARTDGDRSVVVRLDGERHVLDRERAAALRADLTEALAERRAFLHTVSERHPDEGYVVRRRRADSDGNAVRFDSFDALVDLYDGLPASFDAAAVESEGVTGSRRHLLVRHLAEHPAFDCALASENPLVARKEATD